MKREEKIKIALSLANKGFTRDEITEKMKICRRTLERYQEFSPELATILKENEKDLSKLVKTAYKVALGYKNKTQKVVKLKEEYKVIDVEESILPNTDMIKYLLNNRDRLNYSNNPNKDKMDNELLEIKKKIMELDK